MAYTDQQIRDYISQNNLGSNPFGIAAAQQSGLAGVSNSQLDGAMGWAPNTAQGWWDQQGQQHQQIQASGQSGVQTPQPSYYGTGAGQMGPAQSGGQMTQAPALGSPNMQNPSAGSLTGGNPSLNAGGANPYAPAGGNPYMPSGGTSAPAPQQPPMTAGTMQPQPVGQQQAGINPYLGAMGNSIASQSMDNLTRNILPAIRSNSIGNGGLGGSRQGVVEANAVNDTQRNLINSLTGLYGNAFESQQGRDLQRYGMDQNAGLTTRGQDLQRYGMDQNAYLTGRGQDQNFYSTQRGLDFQGQRLGADLFQQGMNGLQQQGQGLTNVGNQQQQMGWQQFQQFANLLGPFTGLNQTNTNSVDASGNPIGGAIAGGLTMAQLWKLITEGK